MHALPKQNTMNCLLNQRKKNNSKKNHFYKKTEKAYYFDYFVKKSDRRNKIRIYVNLEDDAVTAVEFSDYK